MIYVCLKLNSNKALNLEFFLTNKDYIVKFSWALPYCFVILSLGIGYSSPDLFKRIILNILINTLDVHTRLLIHIITFTKLLNEASVHCAPKENILFVSILKQQIKLHQFVSEQLMWLQVSNGMTITVNLHCIMLLCLCRYVHYYYQFNS